MPRSQTDQAPQYHARKVSDADRPDLGHFASGSERLDKWLRDNALTEQARRRCQTFLVHEAEPERLVGYYSLGLTIMAPSGLMKKHTGSDKRAKREQHVAYILAKLAVDQRFQGRKIGSMIVAHAVNRCIAASEEFGGRIIVVDFKTDEMDEFYRKCGFDHAVGRTRRVLTLADAVRAAAESREPEA